MRKNDKPSKQPIDPRGVEGEVTVTDLDQPRGPYLENDDVRRLDPYPLNRGGPAHFRSAVRSWSRCSRRCVSARRARTVRRAATQAMMISVNHNIAGTMGDLRSIIDPSAPGLKLGVLFGSA